MRLSSKLIALVLLAAACTDDPTRTKPVDPDPGPKAPTPLGLFEIGVTGLATDQPTAAVRDVGPAGSGGPRLSLNVNSGTITLELVGAQAFTDGSRTQGGQRYAQFSYRVRNGTGVALNNLTFLLVARASTFAGTPISSLKRVDGTNADPSIASKVVPTGAVSLGSDFNSMLALYPDVIQAFTEAEVAAITKPADVTDIFPYGYMVRSKLTNANRTLPATADPNEFDGLWTLSFRLPLQATSSQDVNSIFFQILAVEDTETRLTETIEEGEDSAAVRRLRDRATALGATTVTVLNGSSATDPAVPDYPGQRQICSLRTAGTSGSPTTTITTPAGYSQIYITRTGEALDPCTAYFRTGTPARPATNVSFTLAVRAMDRYGNQKTVVDTVHVDQVSGPPYAAGPAVALSGGQGLIDVLYSDYGTSVMGGIGRRMHGVQTILVGGVTRTWTAGAGTTNWNTGLNWSPAAVPGTLDSVYVPVAAPLDPALVSNVQIQGATVEDGAIIALGAFDLTAQASVTAGTSGGITNTSGRLFLAGIGQTVQGKVPTLRVTGTYSLTGNVTARAPIQVDAGRLTASAFRLQADSN